MFILWHFWFLHVITAVQWFSKKIENHRALSSNELYRHDGRVVWEDGSYDPAACPFSWNSVAFKTRIRDWLLQCLRVSKKGWGCQSYKWFKCYPFHFRQYHKSRQKLRGNILWLSWFNVPNWSPQFLFDSIIPINYSASTTSIFKKSESSMYHQIVLCHQMPNQPK